MMLPAEADYIIGDRSRNPRVLLEEGNLGPHPGILKRL